MFFLVFAQIYVDFILIVVCVGVRLTEKGGLRLPRILLSDASGAHDQASSNAKSLETIWWNESHGQYLIAREPVSTPEARMRVAMTDPIGHQMSDPNSDKEQKASCL